MDPLAKTERGSNPHYRVTLVERSAVPQGAKGDDWYCYVLENGYASIMGWRRGSLQEITQHAINCTERLNTCSRGVSRPPLYRKTSHRTTETAEKSG
jgi:hypothetical protein